MPNMARATWILILLVIAGLVSFTALGWGLPSLRVDPYLFGHHPVWTGKQIQALLPRSVNLNAGADVAASPNLNRSAPVGLNDTDAKRAEIIRRYRLFSHQPDEMITFMSLSRMHPSRGDFDPRLFQYGSLWIYPVGGLLKICSALHLIQLRGDIVYYLDHPAEFGKFYIVARAYAGAWAVLGALVIFLIAGQMNQSAQGARSWCNSLFNGQVVASLGFIFLPVVVYSSHEAKPHLPGAALCLLAIWMAMRYLANGRRRDAIGMIIFVGLACSMVLTSLPMLAFIPCIFLLKSPRMFIRGIVGALVAIIIYLLLNPYVWIDFFWHRQRLFSNLSNSAAMYHSSALSAIGNAAGLMIAGTSIVVFAIGVAGVLVWLGGRTPLRGAAKNNHDIAKSIAAPLIAGGLMVIPYILFAAGKPAEYGRFAILPDVVLMLLAVWLVTKFPKIPRSAGFLAIIIAAAIPAYGYWHGYAIDHGAADTRLRAAADLAHWAAGKPISLALTAEPAPYCCPAVNLFDWRLVLLPRGTKITQPDLPYDLALSTVDDPPPARDHLWLIPDGKTPSTPMSWASKEFAVTMSKPDVDARRPRK